MAYDFETLHSRRGTGSNKWNGMYQIHPELGDDIVPFSVADMEFANPPQIATGLSSYLDDTILGYTSPTDSYYQAVVDWMDRRHNWKIEKDWIVDYPGVVPALYHLVQAFTRPGEGVILFTPVYYPFYSAVRENGRNIVECPLKLNGTRYEIDFDAFAQKAADPSNKICIFCSPHNPVGRVWTEEELRRVGEICLQNNVLLIADEIHNDLIMPGHQHHVFASLSDEFAQNSIICTAPSKTFNTAGLMTSNLIIASPALRETVKKFRTRQAIFSCNILGYRACEIAYTQCEDWLDELLVVLDQNRKLVQTFFAQHFPQVTAFELEGTYLQWLDFRKLGLSYQALEKFMADEALLFTDEGYLFGETGQGFERINLACPTWVLEKALNRLAVAWQQHCAQ